MTLDEILVATRPVAPPDRSTLDRGRADVVALADTEISLRARRARRRVRRRLLGGVAIAAAAVGAFLVIPHDDGGLAPITAPPTSTTSRGPVVDVDYVNASQMLAATADSARLYTQPLGDAPYWKVVTQSGRDASTRSTRWMGIDGPGVMPFDDDPSRTTRGLFVELPKLTVRLGGRTYTWRDINDGVVPADQLVGLLTETELTHDTGNKADRAAHEYYFFKEAYEILANTPASPAIRMQLWDDVAHIAGVKLDGKVTDAIGRKGWAVSLTTPGQGTQTYVVDPTTGALLESRGHAEGASSEDGWTVTLVEAGPADSAPRPTPRQELMRRLGDG